MKTGLRAAAALLVCCLVLSLVPVSAGASENAPSPTPEVSPDVRFLSYEEALAYFDFDSAAESWCYKFGLDPETRLQDAKNALLAGTDPELIIRLATFARDTGHGGEKLKVTNGFRPACYQEALGLHDANRYTGPYRNSILWNGRGVVSFWWNAESQPGWPERYAIDLSAYDIDTLDLRYYYRAALRLWNNGWVGNYYAKPGCSAHNSGTAIDIGNYWIGANFATSYEYNGVTYSMSDYGLYKPLQPSATSAGETWHITSYPTVQGLGNYDEALVSGFEPVFSLYYNPAHRGWDMSAGWGLYLGAGVTVLQIRLCQLGLLEAKYITGYYCQQTAEAMRAFQSANGLDADGICGAGTLAKLFPKAQPAWDGTAPVLTEAKITSADAAGFRLSVAGYDETALNAFRVDTRREEDQVWVTRYYNAPASGKGVLDVDVWQQGRYEVRVAACDAYGNESELMEPGAVYVDTTPPVLKRVTVYDITETGFKVSASARDDSAVALFRLTLTPEQGELREERQASDAEAAFTVEDVGPGDWTLTVSVMDICGNETSYTFQWTFTAGQAQPGRTVTHYGG